MTPAISALQAWTSPCPRSVDFVLTPLGRFLRSDGFFASCWRIRVLHLSSEESYSAETLGLPLTTALITHPIDAGLTQCGSLREEYCWYELVCRSVDCAGSATGLSRHL